MTLSELFNEKGYDYYPTDKNTTHSYLDTFEELFKEFKEDRINVLELGIWRGGSIRLWCDYFTNGTVFGYDIVDIDEFPHVGHKVIKNVCDISPTEFNEYPLTIAIDDGSHVLSDQLLFIQLIYPQLVEGGILVVEDIQNIESQKEVFDSLNISYTIIDLRSVKGRYDDVLLVFKKKSPN